MKETRMTRREQVLDFWFDPANKPYWFQRSDAFDAAIERRLGGLHGLAVAGDLHAWADSPKGALALCLLLDQVPRNLFRGSPEAFASDEQARRSRAARSRPSSTRACRRNSGSFSICPSSIARTWRIRSFAANWWRS